MQPPAHPPMNMPQTESDRVILVGASVRSAAESAKRAGKRVIGIDLFGDTDTLAACDQHLCFRSVTQRTSATAIAINRLRDVPVLVVGGLGQKLSLPAILRRRAIGPMSGGRTAVSIDSLERITKAACVRFPRTQVWTESGDGHVGHWPEPPSARQRWLVKQSRSTAGFGVTWADSRQPTSPPLPPISAHLPPRSPHVRQLWIAGRSIGVTYLADGSRALLLGACRSRFTRRGKCPFIYSGSVGPIRLVGRVVEQLRHLGDVCVDVLGLRGIFNVDLVIDRCNRLWVLEINPRWSASSEVLEPAWSQQLGPLFRWHLGLLQRTIAFDSSSCDRLLREAHQPFQVWKRIVFARRPGSFDRHWLDQTLRQGLRRTERQTEVPVRIADVPKHGTPIARSEPILTLLHQFPNDLPPRLHSLRRLIEVVEHSVRPL